MMASLAQAHYCKQLHKYMYILMYQGPEAYSIVNKVTTTYNLSWLNIYKLCTLNIIKCHRLTMLGLMASYINNNIQYDHRHPRYT